MSNKKRVNKTFEESCKKELLFIDQNNGTHWCISKESPKSRKFDKNFCQLFACPDYISKEIESFSKKEKKIRGYLKKGKSTDFIMKNTPCSRATYFRVKKRMEEDEKTLEKEKIESDEESKAYQKIEPMPARPPRSVSARKTRVPARNRVYQTTEKPRPIKLKLSGHYQTAIRHALDNSHIWIEYNIQEIRTYLKEFELNLNPVPVEYMLEREPYSQVTKKSYNSIGERKHLYNVLRTGWKTGLEYYNNVKIHKLDIQWKKPKCSIWIERRLQLWEISHDRRGLKNANLTTEEWYKKMELPFPQKLEPEATMFIHARNDLERSGILREIEYLIVRELRISDEIEEICNSNETPNATTLFHWKNLLRENPHHPYAILLKEKILLYKNRGI